MRKTTFTATYKDGSKYKWAFEKDNYGWWLIDYEGVKRYLEKTWIDSVPIIHLILDNYGMTANIS